MNEAVLIMTTGWMHSALWCGHGSILLSCRENIIMRIGMQQYSIVPSLPRSFKSKALKVISIMYRLNNKGIQDK